MSARAALLTEGVIREIDPAAPSATPSTPATAAHRRLLEGLLRKPA